MNMDKGLDLKKAFDCIDHDVLVKKMYYNYRIRGLTLKLFQSYLTNRTQICKVDKTMSNTRTVKCGIPQGSNLGPLLFLLHINDLPTCLTSSSTSMFDNDTNISTQGTTEYEIHERLNVDLENVHQWLVENKLTLNKQKTEYMIIGLRQRISNIITNSFRTSSLLTSYVLPVIVLAALFCNFCSLSVKFSQQLSQTKPQ